MKEKLISMKKDVITSLVELDACSILELKVYVKIYNNYINFNRPLDAYDRNKIFINNLFGEEMITTNVCNMFLLHNDRLFDMIRSWGC